MSDLIYNLDDQAVRAAMAKAPEVMKFNISLVVGRAAREGARIMHDEAGKHDLFGTLKQSIRFEGSGLERFITPGMNYAAAVNDGTGPAAGKARYFPNKDSLAQYIWHKPEMRGYDWAKLGSKKRMGQESSIRRRAGALALFIYKHGTQPTHFVDNSVEPTTMRFFELMDAGVAQCIAEIGA